jgi:hypothetical protein
VSILTTYHPNFCAECGEKIVRLRWHVWTSGRFCDACAPSFRKERRLQSSLAVGILLSLGFITGRALKPTPAPLIIQRSAGVAPLASVSPAASQLSSAQPPAVSEEVYICGARTKKGTPCSRRVHGLVRCWQHKGSRAMLPPDKLIVKE